jgi:hypothetical protein
VTSDVESHDDDEIVPPYDDLTSRGAFAIGLYHGASMLAQLAHGDARGAALHGKASAAWLTVSTLRKTVEKMVAVALQPAEHPPEVADPARELDG